MAALLHVLAAAVLCLPFFCWKASGQLPSDNFSLEIFGPTQVIQARGSAASFTCQLGIGVSYRLKYKIQWVYVSAPGLQSVEKTLTEDENVKDGGKYSVNIQVKGLQDPTPVVLTIKNVTDTDGGRYLCRVVHLQNTGTVKETEVSFSVQHEVERVELQIDQREAVTSSDSQVTLPEGRHKVRCSALAFNPSSDYNLNVYFGNDELVGQDSSVPVPVLMEEKAKAAGAPRYSLEKTIPVVELTEDNSAKTLKCVAQNARLNTQREAAVTITVTQTDTDDDDGESGNTSTEDGSFSGVDTEGNGAIGDHRQAGLPVLLATLALLLCTLL